MKCSFRNLKIGFAFFLVFSFGSVVAQTNAIAYQTILANANGDPYKSLPVELWVDIIEGSSNGSVVFSESYNVTTGLNGEIELAIGTGSAEFMTFANVDWSKPSFVELTFRPEGFPNFFSIGKVEMLSVPYALFALNLKCDDGCPGQDGADGKHGEEGAQGPTGFTGWNPSQPETGPPGDQGPQGISGLQSLKITDTAPITPLINQFYLDDGSNRVDGQPGFRIWNGSEWVNI